MRESWLVEDRWWTERPLRRRYWEVVTTCGRNEVVFHDLESGRWWRQRYAGMRASAPLLDRDAPRLVGMPQHRSAIDPGPLAVGTWSGGRFMHFGEPLDDERLSSLIAPDEAIPTVITADVYGTGDADRMLGRAIAGRAARAHVRGRRRRARLLRGRARRAAGAFPASPIRGCADPTGMAAYLRMATERSLERCGIDSFDLLLLHNPDRIGYTERDRVARRWRRCATPG